MRKVSRIFVALGFLVSYVTVSIPAWGDVISMIPKRTIWLVPYADKKELDVNFSTYIGNHPKRSLFCDLNINLVLPGPCDYEYILYKKSSTSPLKIVSGSGRNEHYGTQKIKIYYIDVSKKDSNSSESYILHAKAKYYTFSRTKKMDSDDISKQKHDDTIIMGYKNIYIEDEYSYTMTGKESTFSNYKYNFDITYGNQKLKRSILDCSVSKDGKICDIYNNKGY